MKNSLNFFLVFLIFASGILPHAVANTQLSDELVPDTFIQLGDNTYFPKYAFIVSKSKRSLAIWEQVEAGQLRRLKEYDADLGAREGDKLRRDDHRTPEGAYFLETTKKAPEIPFDLYGSRAYTTNYPNYFDRLQKKTGSGIWLHAVPDQVPLTRGSRGCVVLRDQAVLDVEPYVKGGQTPFVVQHSTDMVTPEELSTRLKLVRQFLAKWLNDWETQNIEKYMTHYNQQFRGQRMNIEQWKKHKEQLKRKYEFIKLTVSEPLIIKNKDQLIVRFLQSYESNKFQDFGEKTLHIFWRDNQFSIVGEDWLSVNSEIAQIEIKKRPFSRELPQTTTAVLGF